ncbi:MAG: hypothetical protein AB1768_03050 [Pseudomonadota bacterium]|jgi:hypothetical protein
MEIITVTLPAVWAAALMLDDWYPLEYAAPDDAAKAKAWQMESGLRVLSCGERQFIARFDGVLTECREYRCTRLDA